MTHHAEYLTPIFDKILFGEVVDSAIANLSKWGEHKFDAIACTGISGLAVAAPVSYILDKYLIVVRKQIEDSHSAFNVETSILNGNYIIIDDFIETGTTINDIILNINGLSSNDLNLVGIYTYYRHLNNTQTLKDFDDIEIIDGGI